jgi:hypothetical protein
MRPRCGSFAALEDDMVWLTSDFVHSSQDDIHLVKGAEVIGT